MLDERSESVPGLAGAAALIARLVRARKAANLTQEQAADHLGMSRPTFIAIEKGTRAVAPAEVIALAALYGRSVHDLTRPGEPVTLAPHLRAAVDPNGKESPALRVAIKELEEFAEDYQRLEQMLHSPLSADYPPETKLPGRGGIKEFAEDAAGRERSRLQLGEGPILNLRRTLESEAGVRIFYGDLPSIIAGMYAFVPDLGYCILINRKHPPERQRASAAHEYGHFLVDRHKSGVDYVTTGGNKSASERFCDAFSMAFLMPRIGLRRHFQQVVNTTQDFQVGDLVRLANLYFVSVQAMALRLEGLGVIGGGWWDMLLESDFRPEAAREQLKLPQRPSECDRPYPERYKFLAVHAFERGLISEGQLAKYLRTDCVDARAVVAECSTGLEVNAKGEPQTVKLPFGKSLFTAPDKVG